MACLDVKAPGQALGFFCCGTGCITLGSSCLCFCLQLGCLLGSVACSFVPPVEKGGGSLGFLAVIKGAFLRRQPAALCHLLHTQVFSFSSVCLSFLLSYFLCFFLCFFLSFFLIFFVSFFVSFFLSFFLSFFCCLLNKHQLHIWAKFSSKSQPPTLRCLRQYAQQQYL